MKYHLVIPKRAKKQIEKIKVLRPKGTRYCRNSLRSCIYWPEGRCIEPLSAPRLGDVKAKLLHRSHSTSLIESKHRQRIILALTSLEDDPHAGKPLEGDHKGHWSYRVGVYRIIYEIRRDELIVLVINIGHRRDVYK